MPQSSAQQRVSARPVEPQEKQWCGIGIHAVAAASIYVDRESRRRVMPAPSPVLLRQPDYATD